MREWNFVWDVIMFFGYALGCYMIITGLLQLFDDYRDSKKVIKRDNERSDVLHEEIVHAEKRKRGRPKGSKNKNSGQIRL